jgi:hypothetical protein
MTKNLWNPIQHKYLNTPNYLLHMTFLPQHQFLQETTLVFSLRHVAR